MEDELSGKNLLKVNNLIKKYNKKIVLNINSFVINKKDRIALIGMPECGKSTLFEILIGLRNKSKGKILKNNDLVIGFQNQNNNYPNFITAYDYIKLYLDNYYIDLKSERLHFLLNNLNLLNCIYEPFIYLTFTQKQKINILIGILMEPNLLILDEITQNIDEHTRKLISNFIQKFYNEDSAMIFSTHNLKDVEELSNSIWLMHNGRIIEQIKTEDVITIYGSVKKYLSSQFKEYDIKSAYSIKKDKHSWKDEINKEWARKWDNSNEKRKTRINKY